MSNEAIVKVLLFILSTLNGYGLILSSLLLRFGMHQNYNHVVELMNNLSVIYNEIVSNDNE